MITVARLEDARVISTDISKVLVHRDRQAPITLLRRTAGEVVQGLSEQSCKVGSRVKFPKTAVLVNGTVVEDEIEIGEGCILDNCKFSGEGKIKPFAVLRNLDLVGMGKDVELPMRELRLR